MISWILALMVLAAPADAPRERFEEIAQAVHDATGGDVGPIVELVALGAREGHFNPEAVSQDYAGRAFGCWQLHETNFSWLGIDALDATSAELSAPVALRMIVKSHHVCSTRPVEDQLAWYAAGGPSCDVPEGLADSRNRVALEVWLLRQQPAPELFVETNREIHKSSSSNLP